MIEVQRREKMQATIGGEASLGGFLKQTGPFQFSSHLRSPQIPDSLESENPIPAFPQILPFKTPYFNFTPPPFLYGPDFQPAPFMYQTCQGQNGQFFYSAGPIPFRTVMPQQMEPNLQDFQYFVVIDFEATCDKDNNPQPQEIIEFPSVLINTQTGQLEASFQTYVRPMYNQRLTEFCKELTGIQQIQVDRGVPLSEAILMHDKWLEEKGVKNKNFAVVTWSNWDCQVMLEGECKFKNIRKPPYFNRWINLKVPFGEMFQKPRCNLKEAVQTAGLTWEGRAHCGLDDARNTARLMALMMHRGFKFSITNSLTWHPDSNISISSSSPPKGESAASPPQQQGPIGIVGPIEMVGPVGPIGMVGPMCCFCGVMSSKNWVRRPGPTQGRCFFGCGNWTANRRAVCNYFMWAAPAP
ncbi:hypothetical protein LUZ60_003976 [Juncus effusus]|nr:hypothetical protein LUZ60_003976 [Juncus effusus]